MGVRSIKVGGKEVRTADLPYSIYADIERETGIPWFDVWGRPLANASAATMLITAACEYMGVECPVLTPATVLECVVTDEEAEETPGFYEEGLPAKMPADLPLEASDPPTG